MTSCYFVNHDCTSYDIVNEGIVLFVSVKAKGALLGCVYGIPT